MGKKMKSKLIWIALLLFSSNTYSIKSFEDFLKDKDIEGSKFTRVDCERKSSYTKHHAHIYPFKGRYVRPNLYDYVYIELTESNNKKKYNIWGETSSNSQFNSERMQHTKVDYWVMTYPNLTITKETSNSIIFQVDKDIDGRVDIFDLDKLNGNLKMHVWEIKTTQTKPNDTFKFKQESAKKDLVHTETVQFTCK
jgi:hypothetical protein